MHKATLYKIKHKGMARIKVAIPNKDSVIAIIKKIPGRQWSQSKRCWHVPYKKETFKLLQQHFDVTYQEEITTDQPSVLPDKEKRIEATKPPAVSSVPILNYVNVLPEHQYRVKVLIPKQRKDWIIKIKQLANRAWNMEQKYWSVPKTKTTLDHLQQLFGEALKIDANIQWENLATTQQKQKEYLNKEAERATINKVKGETKVVKKDNKSRLSKTVFRTIQQDDRTIKMVVGQQLVLEKEDEKWLRIYVPYDKKGWIEVVKDIPGRKWSVDDKFWLVPYVKDSFKRLWNLIGKDYIQLSFEINSNIPAEFRIKKQSNKRPPSYQLNKVQQKALIAFDEKMMLENKAWRTMLKQEEKVIKLERPKKKKKLPNVFSLEEIELLLKALTNLKHKCMLILVYSGGLRRSEVLNLGVDDLNFSRKTLFIKNAKGGKDRYTFFSDIAQKHLKEYLKQYQPKYYLFEGQTGGRYSESSLQSIYEQARRKSRLPLNVTLHGLRHSFATHLVEKGIPLHVVQDLLGHASIKTTEIYLHISNKFRKELKSPLDDLNI